MGPKMIFYCTRINSHSVMKNRILQVNHKSMRQRIEYEYIYWNGVRKTNNIIFYYLYINIKKSTKERKAYGNDLDTICIHWLEQVLITNISKFVFAWSYPCTWAAVENTISWNPASSSLEERILPNMVHELFRCLSFAMRLFPMGQQAF